MTRGDDVDPQGVKGIRKDQLPEAVLALDLQVYRTRN